MPTNTPYSTSSTQTDPRQILFLDLEQLLLNLNEIHDAEQFKETLKTQIYTIITASKESGLTNVEVMETVKTFCRANQSEP